MAKKNLYFVAIVPEEPVREQVHQFKCEAADRYGSKAALKSPPHITLHMPFQWRDDREDQLLEVMRSFSFDRYPIELTLDGFDFFPPRVVYIKVEENEALRELQKDLCDHIRRELNIFNATYKDMGFHPHMTIAFRDLKKTLFPQVMEDYSQRNFQTKMTVAGFTLLKNESKQWQEVLYTG
ncbi:2'-5' RNA ligase family protein [Reichenbachiella agariperforans]|uniref:2'-5' RNA ligase n=1 Tax=Reichenbachiella agariperforans TaxID=156994 RepID=A0A1M6QJQ4_REIAG|nr:2'-5' RNA ligase family protein [Reichenbachiella agariperforans]MBU2914401.1 2'-5' RNA ligase family protein [Reichenbachiella agariperforans]SHK20472.1 2'-5' RNA ligase [Reichenbachiella agariperforans]